MSCPNLITPWFHANLSLCGIWGWGVHYTEHYLKNVCKESTQKQRLFSMHRRGTCTCTTVDSACKALNKIIDLYLDCFVACNC